MKSKITCLAFGLLLPFFCNAQEKNSLSALKTEKENYKMQPIHMQSRWAQEVSPGNVLKEYPRPQMVRENWENLNGLWEYAITDSSQNAPNAYAGTILVPFPIESALSGVQKKLMPAERLWYRRTLQYSKLPPNERLLLHFDAIDWESTVFINGKKIGQHTGGYENFFFDITNYLIPGKNELVVKVFDPSDQGPNPHGKQVLNPGNIYYTPSSGIWQTVWLEKVPIKHISNIKLTPDIDKGLLNISINTTAETPDLTLEISAIQDGKIINIKKQIVTRDKNARVPTTSFSLEIPQAHLWSPDDPFLYDLSVKLLKGREVVDKISSYFGMRKIDIQKDDKGSDRIFLNNKYTYNLGVLDQGFWPEGLYTAPTDEALAFDIKAAKAMGFNTIRKHIKIEPNRWYYHADKIGVMVWQDFVNPPHNLPEGSKPIFEKEVRETMDQLHNYPSIITWVLFNERWGAYDQQRLTEWVKKYDPSRIVNGHSGELLYVNDQLREPSVSPWISSDLTDVHSYPDPRNAPGQAGKARVVGEFGGIGVSVPGHQWDDMQGWGYIQIPPEELSAKYKQMINELKKLELEGLSGSIYTEPYDVEGEENGLLTYDREIIKIPITEIRAINNNLVNQTAGFKLNPKFVIAEDIDTKDNDNRYAELITSYEKGERDSSFLRRLLLMAIRKREQSQTTLIGREYINQLKDPYSKENLTFINKITRKTVDKGFEMFNSNAQKVDAVLGPNTVIYKLKSIIDKEKVTPYLNTHLPNPNWDSLQQAITNKYGDIGAEIILGKRMYYSGLNQDWENYGKYFVLYFEKALHHPDYMINNIAWPLFEHVNDQKVLSFAVDVMKYCIDTWDKTPESFDTYANLLHKINKSDEAIKWEEKALKLKKGAADEKIYADILQKMKSGQPTWPTNN